MTSIAPGFLKPIMKKAFQAQHRSRGEELIKGYIKVLSSLVELTKSKFMILKLGKSFGPFFKSATMGS